LRGRISSLMFLGGVLRRVSPPPQLKRPTRLRRGRDCAKTAQGDREGGIETLHKILDRKIKMCKTIFVELNFLAFLGGKGGRTRN